MLAGLVAGAGARHPRDPVRGGGRPWPHHPAPRALQAPGMLYLTQKFTFSAHDPVIRLEVEMELLPDASPQALYFAMPLALEAGWQALFDTAGAVVRVDDDQLPGACRNWVTTETLAAMWDARWRRGPVHAGCADGAIRRLPFRPAARHAAAPAQPVAAGLAGQQLLGHQFPARPDRPHPLALWLADIRRPRRSRHACGRRPSSSARRRSSGR